MELDSPVINIAGVGPAQAKKFLDLGIYNIEDLLNYFPRRYDDYSKVESVSKLKPGRITIKASIKQVTGRYVRRGMHITEAVASDTTGSVRLIWFNQPYRQASLHINTEYYISGIFELRRQRLSITNPSIELVSAFPLHTARIVPVYKEVRGLTSANIRRAIENVRSLLRSLPETLPDWIISQHKLMSRSAAYEYMHFPDDNTQLLKAKHRLGFEEVLALSLASLLNKHDIDQNNASSIKFNESLARRFVGHLSFRLTNDQRKAVWQIYQDMDSSRPMNRLVEGDVGSGKTVVAVMAAVMALAQGFQVAYMAPTELLARQHAENIFNLLEPLGLSEQVGLLVGGMTNSQKEQARQKITDNTTGFIIGTHTLLQEKIDMHELGLVIIDEQHRFGVEQRKILQAKANKVPHTLTMTATPIPRSLALTLYGELDISIIQAKPIGRLPIITTISSPNSRTALYRDIDKQLQAGRQMFVVCPIISESNARQQSSATVVYESLKNGAFSHRRVGLLHGKMKPQEKTKIMNQFLAGKLDILVSTTVIEVGVDVPNATVMMIENPERFGLAQLHQLRGRVGRGEHQGYCYLVLSDSSPPSKRLRALEQSLDGFELANLDLELRGPGAIYGTQQHGALDLKVATLTDSRLIALSRKAAVDFINSGTNLIEYEELYKRVNKLRSLTTLN